MFRVSGAEALALSKSTLIVALVFTIAYGRPFGAWGAVLLFFVSLIGAGAGFFLHELMHKLLASEMGFEAEYREGGFPLVSILFALAGWIILSPGAVYIGGAGRAISNRANGLISLAGPATNIALALLFRAASLAGYPMLDIVGSFGFHINSWLALFNMLPAPGFDGEKVWQWNKAVFILFGAACAAVFFLLGPGGTY